jgi:GNAT superfamily N-acetyltransferase
MSQITFAETDEDIRRCFPAMYVLRPHLTGREFVEQVRRQQQQGYHLVLLREQEQVKCVAGFRLLEFLAWGKVLYIDDLVTEPGEKRQGYGGHMIDWLIGYAREHACNQVHLDSGYQRHDAHRFYLGKGFTLSSHHFALKLWY